jgi:hypothetical protein
VCVNGTNGNGTTQNVFTPIVMANKKNVTNESTIKYTPATFALNKTNTYQVGVTATYKNKNAYTFATIYVCSGEYRCNSTNNGCTK